MVLRAPIKVPTCIRRYISKMGKTIKVGKKYFI
jgi:hypothetical protein